MKRAALFGILLSFPLLGSADMPLYDALMKFEQSRRPAYEWQCPSPFLVIWATTTINWQRERIAELERQLAAGK